MGETLVGGGPVALVRRDGASCQRFRVDLVAALLALCCATFAPISGGFELPVIFDGEELASGAGGPTGAVLRAVEQRVLVVARGVAESSVEGVTAALRARATPFVVTDTSVDGLDGMVPASVPPMPVDPAHALDWAAPFSAVVIVGSPACVLGVGSEDAALLAGWEVVWRLRRVVVAAHSGPCGWGEAHDGEPSVTNADAQLRFADVNDVWLRGLNRTTDIPVGAGILKAEGVPLEASLDGENGGDGALLAALADERHANGTAALQSVDVVASFAWDSAEESAAVLRVAWDDGREQLHVLMGLPSAGVLSAAPEGSESDGAIAWPEFAVPAISTLWTQWLSGGVFVGGRYQVFGPKVDGVFMSAPVWGSTTGETARMEPASLDYHADLQRRVNEALPPGSRVVLELGFAGFGVALHGGSDEDLLFSRCQDLAQEFYWVSQSYSQLSFTVVNQQSPPCADAIAPACPGGEFSDACIGVSTPKSGVACELELNQEFADVLFGGAPCATLWNATLPGFEQRPARCSSISARGVVTPGSSGLFNLDALAAMAEGGVLTAVGDNTCTHEAVAGEGSSCDGVLLPPVHHHGFYVPADEGSSKVLVLPRHSTDIFFDVTTPEQAADEFRAVHGHEGDEYSSATSETVLQLSAARAAYWVLSLRHDSFLFHQANMVTFDREDHAVDLPDFVHHVAEGSHGEESLVGLWLASVARHLSSYSALPVISEPQDSLGLRFKRRMEGDECGARVVGLFASGSSRWSGADGRAESMLVGVLAWSDLGKSCEIGITGAMLLHVSEYGDATPPSAGVTWASTTVEHHGPDVTSWLQVEGSEPVVAAVDLHADVVDFTVHASDVLLGATSNGTVTDVQLSALVLARQRHPLGFHRALSGARLRLQISGAGWAEGEVEEQAAGSYAVAFTPTRPGDYSISLQLGRADSTWVELAEFAVSAALPEGGVECDGVGFNLGLEPRDCICEYDQTTTVSVSTACSNSCSNDALAPCCHCKCPAGRWGVDCTGICPGDEAAPCSNVGACNALTGVCDCATGFWGESCGNVCPGGVESPCGGHGSCRTDSGECLCDMGWWGDECSLECPGVVNGIPCSGHGTCSQRTGSCECDATWFGPTCSKHCHPVEDCGGAGRCGLEGQCSCRTGWSGLNCEVGPCGIDNGCSGHGTCVDLMGDSLRRCSCEAGYFGASCQSQCPGADDGLACSGHGDCDAVGRCVCTGDWWGERCDRSCAEDAEQSPQQTESASLARVALRVLVTFDESDVGQASLQLARRVLQARYVRWEEWGLVGAAGTPPWETLGLKDTAPFNAIILAVSPDFEDHGDHTEVLGSLEAYERRVGARRVVLSSSPRLSSVSAASADQAMFDVVSQSRTISATAAGAAYAAGRLAADTKIPVQVPIRPVFVPPSLSQSCSLVTSFAVFSRVTSDEPEQLDAAVVVSAVDGRQELHFLFDQSENLLASLAFSPVWLDWVTRGVYVGGPSFVPIGLDIRDICDGMSTDPRTAVATVDREWVKLDSELFGEVAQDARLGLALTESADDEVRSAVEQSETGVLAAVAEDLRAICHLRGALVAPSCEFKPTAIACPADRDVLLPSARRLSQLNDDIATSATLMMLHALIGEPRAHLFEPRALESEDGGASPFVSWVSALLSGLEGAMGGTGARRVQIMTSRSVLDWNVAAKDVRDCDLDVALLTRPDDAQMAIGLAVSRPPSGRTACSLPVHGVDVVGATAEPSSFVGAARTHAELADGVDEMIVAVEVPVEAKHCSVRALPPQFTIGSDNEFQVEIVHPLGMGWDVPEAPLQVEVKCARNLAKGKLKGLDGLLDLQRFIGGLGCTFDPEIAYVGAGVSTIKVQPRAPNALDVSVTLNGEHVNGSPFLIPVRFGAGPIVAAAVFCIGLVVSTVWGCYTCAGACRRWRKAERKEAESSSEASDAPKKRNTPIKEISILLSRASSCVVFARPPSANSAERVPALAELLTPSTIIIADATSAWREVDNVKVQLYGESTPAEHALLFAAVDVRAFREDIASQCKQLKDHIRQTISSHGAGFDGVLLQGVDVLLPIESDSAIGAAIAAVGVRGILVEGGPNVFSVSPDLLDEIDGVVVVNPTMDRTGTPFPQTSAQVQRRNELLRMVHKRTKSREGFVLLAIERVVSPATVQPAGAHEFVHNAWASQLGVSCLPFLHAWHDRTGEDDDTATLPWVSHPHGYVPPVASRALGPVGVFELPGVSALLKAAAESADDAVSPSAYFAEVIETCAKSPETGECFDQAWHAPPNPSLEDASLKEQFPHVPSELRPLLRDMVEVEHSTAPSTPSARAAGGATTPRVSTALTARVVTPRSATSAANVFAELKDGQSVAGPTSHAPRSARTSLPAALGRPRSRASSTASGWTSMFASTTAEAATGDSSLLRGQCALGVQLTDGDWHRIIALHGELRRKGLLNNIGATADNEVYSGSQDTNSIVQSSSPEFERLVAALEAANDDPVEFVVDAFQEQADLVGSLLSALACALSDATATSLRITVWCTDSFALRAPGRAAGALACAEVDHGRLHIYVSREHPNLAEAVLHCFFQWHGFTRSQCTLLECLVSKLASRPADVLHDVQLSDRVVEQLLQSAPKELALLIQRTRSIIARHAVAADVDIVLREALQGVSLAVHEGAKARLFELGAQKTASSIAPNLGFVPSRLRNSPGRQLTLLCRAATWHPQAAAFLDGLAAFLREVSKAAHAVPPSARLLVDAVESLRVDALEQILHGFRSTLPYPVNDPDVAVVNAEMLGYSDERLQHIFRLPRREFGRILYSELRHILLAEDPAPEVFEDKPTSSTLTKSAEDSTLLRQAALYAHGLFFSLPALLDQVLSLWLGSGLFVSGHMSEDTRTVLSLAMLLGFLLTGAVNAAISSSTGLFLFQSSAPVAAMLVLERIVSGGLFIAIVSVLGAIAVGVTASPSDGAFFFAYSLAFSTFLMLVAAVLSLELGNNFFKRGGRAVLIAVGILCLPPVLLSFDVTASLGDLSTEGYTSVAAEEAFVGAVDVDVTFAVNSELPAEPLYVASLLLAVIWLATRVRKVSQQASAAFDDLKPTSDTDVVYWYRPELRTEGLPGGSELVQLTEEARVAFANAIQRALRLPGDIRRFGSLVKHRTNVYKAEDQLLDWFCTFKSMAKPKPWSSAWDRLLEQATSEMLTKAHTQRALRGSLMWTREGPQVLFGFLYFVLVFSDRLLRLVLESRAFVFLGVDINDEYSFAVGWATAYFVTASAALELHIHAVARAGASNHAIRNLRLGPGGATVDDVARTHASIQRRVFRRELLYLLRTVVIGVGVSAGMMWLFFRSVSVVIWGVFGLACLGYSGLLFGLFCKLFSGARTDLAGIAMFRGVVIGIVGGFLAHLIWPWSGASVMSLLLGGVSYGFFSWQVSRRVRGVSGLLDSEDLGVSILTPAMQTSGQRWVGLDGELKQPARRLLSKLDSHLRQLAKYHRNPILSNDSVGMAVIAALREAANFAEDLWSSSETHILCLAFPRPHEMLHRLYQSWQAGRISVEIVPDEALRSIDGRVGYSAIAVQPEAPAKRGERQVEMHVFVGVSWDVADSPAELVRPISEALVHEYVERVLGRSHADACLAELLVCRPTSPLVNCLPSRVLRQLFLHDSSQLRNLAVQTAETVLEKCLLGLDIDRKWGTWPTAVQQALVCVIEMMDPSPEDENLNSALIEQLMPAGKQLTEMAAAVDEQRAANGAEGDALMTLDAPPEFDRVASEDRGASARLEPSTRGMSKLVSALSFMKTLKHKGGVAHAGEDGGTAFVPALLKLIATAQLAAILASNIGNKAEELRASARQGNERVPSRDPQVESSARLTVKHSIDDADGDGAVSRKSLTVDLSAAEKSFALNPFADPRPYWQRDDRLRDRRGCLRWPGRTWRRIGTFVRVGARLSFLAFTGDPCFGRELHSSLDLHLAGTLARKLSVSLVWVFAVARRLKMLLVREVLWRTRPRLWLLLKNISGLNRTIHRMPQSVLFTIWTAITPCLRTSSQSEMLRIAAVERHKPFEEVTAFAHVYRSASGDKAELRLHVYKGSLAYTFASATEPYRRQGLQHVCVYREAEGARGLRLHSRVYYDAGSSPVRSDVYKFDSEQSASLFPSQRVTYKHNSAGSATVDRRAWYDGLGRVVREEFEAVPKGRPDDCQRIQASHCYSSEGHEVVESIYRGVPAATSHAVERRSWVIVVRRWAFQMRGDERTVVPANRVLAVASLIDGECSVTTLSYLHPRHPNIVTSRMSRAHLRNMTSNLSDGENVDAWAAVEKERRAHIETPEEVAADIFGVINRTCGDVFEEEDLLFTAGMKTRGHWRVGWRAPAQVLTFLFTLASIVLADSTWGGSFEGRQVSVVALAVLTAFALSTYWPRRFAFDSVHYARAPMKPHRARSMLWNLWRTKAKEPGNGFDAVHVRLIDATILRGASSLKKYWAARDRGDVRAAQRSLLDSADAVAADMFLSDSKNVRSHLYLRVSDLLICATGGDSASVLGAVAQRAMDRERGQMSRTVKAIGLDSGTWPMDGGGVASCRRDIVDRIASVKWDMIAEIGHELRTIHDAYQVERNVLSVQYVPLWGNNLGTLVMTMLSVPFAEMERRSHRTTPAAIRNYFVPIFERLCRLCAQRYFTPDELIGARALVRNMYLYFQRYDWAMTWQSAAVNATWLRFWHARTQDTPGGSVMAAERPTVYDMSLALSMFVHFLTPLAVTLPSKAPVVQATHHGIQTLLGIVAQQTNGSALVVWDHGILWRERLLGLSTFRGVAPFVRNVIVGLSRLCSSLVLHSADAVVPCTVINNPEWEMWLGGCRGDSNAASLVRKRICPVVNGMETDRFHVDRSKEEKRPSALMLSHVCDVKDVKNAIYAADVIVNQVGLRDYQLIVYGNLSREPIYATECSAMISAMGLEQNVVLEGSGPAAQVIGRGWIFLNSSKSEGLPLALGEAGLAGLPVVCTDVGGSRQIVQDGHLSYGAMAPPGEPRQLAMAQLKVLAMTDGLAEMVEDPEAWVANGGREPGARIRTLPSLLREDAAATAAGGAAGGPSPLLQRIHEASPLRRRLGMLYRVRVLREFGMPRYLREHEAVLWTASNVALHRRGAQTLGMQQTTGFRAAVDGTRVMSRAGSRGSSRAATRIGSVSAVMAALAMGGSAAPSPAGSRAVSRQSMRTRPMTGDSRLDAGLYDSDDDTPQSRADGRSGGRSRVSSVGSLPGPGAARSVAD